MKRGFLTAAERERLSTYPKDISDWDLGRYFTLASDDLHLLEKLRGDDNHLGFALQLCTLRYLGFIPDDLLKPPATVTRLLAHQLDFHPGAIKDYGQREQTRSDHLLQVMEYLNYRRAATHDLVALEEWLVDRALEHGGPTFLLQLAAERLLWERILRPG